MNILLFADITLLHYLIVGTMLFTLGIAGISLARSSAISILISIEIMMLGIIMNFIAFSVALQDLFGQVFAIFIIAVAAAKISIGLSLLVLFFRTQGNIDMNTANRMRD